MGRTLEMFAKPTRRKPRVLMRVWDAGIGNGDRHIVVFRCKHCGHETDWTEVRTVTEAKRGAPCPICNNTTQDEVTK